MDSLYCSTRSISLVVPKKFAYRIVTTVDPSGLVCLPVITICSFDADHARTPETRATAATQTVMRRTVICTTRGRRHK